MKGRQPCSLEVIAKQQEIFAREAQLEAEQEALDADGAA